MRRVLFIFGQLSDDDIEWLVTRGERTEIPTGNVLIHEGVHAPNLYFLIDGRMSVDVGGVGRVANLGRGEVIGEMSFVDSSPPGATVTAREDCLLLGINKEEILSHMKQDSDFASRFYKALAIFLSNRLRDTTLQMRGEKPADGGDEDDKEGQLDDMILKTVHLAAYRFNRLVEKVRG
ncbi:MAG: cyclic nucleotide-binding domain-containing protein [Alphaproteobacteria bacterium]|nr:cyclic nucleotide-binding domain-containing protein [Alphaproteobacteria bacterium]